MYAAPGRTAPHRTVPVKAEFHCTADKQLYFLISGTTTIILYYCHSRFTVSVHEVRNKLENDMLMVTKINMSVFSGEFGTRIQISKNLYTFSFFGL